MFGLVHVVLKDLVERARGAGAWRAVLRRAGVTDDAPLLQLAQHADELTLGLVRAAAAELELDDDDALRALGAAFARYVAVGSTHRRLRAMGDTFVDFLDHVNALHSALETVYRHSSLPCFALRAASTADAPADTDHRAEHGGAQAVELAYSSTRGARLAPMVEGVLVEIAAVLHAQRVEMRRMSAADARAAFPGADAAWHVTVAPPERAPAGVVGGAPSNAPQPRSAAHARAAASWHSVFARGQATVAPEPSHARTAEAAAAADAEAEATPAAREGWLSALARSVRTRVVLGSLSRTALAPRHRASLSGRGCAASAPPPALGLADRLMRATPAPLLCADWEEGPALARARDFWAASSSRASDYALSQPAEHADFFVSHAWAPPDGFAEAEGARCSYAALKATALRAALREACGEARWRDATLFVDKASIPQEPALKQYCIEHLPDFTLRCERMLVLLSWHYFSRLWCVVEWVTFLVSHGPEALRVCVAPFMRSASTTRRFVESVEHFTVASAQCTHAADRDVLTALVSARYTSVAAFERYARATALALIALDLCRPASRAESARAELFEPWLALAARLGEEHLVAALAEGHARLLGWRRAALAGAIAAASPSSADGIGVAPEWQPRFDSLVQEWYCRALFPALCAIKKACVRPELQTVAALRARGTGGQCPELALCSPAAHAPVFSLTRPSGASPEEEAPDDALSAAGTSLCASSPGCGRQPAPGSGLVGQRSPLGELERATRREALVEVSAILSAADASSPHAQRRVGSDPCPRTQWWQSLDAGSSASAMPSGATSRRRVRCASWEQRAAVAKQVGSALATAVMPSRGEPRGGPRRRARGGSSGVFFSSASSPTSVPADSPLGGAGGYSPPSLGAHAGGPPWLLVDCEASDEPDDDCHC